MAIIKVYRDGSVLERDRGSFDEWCVYITRPRIARHAPRDVDYIGRLQQLGEIYGNDVIYQDFVQVYNNTGVNIDNNVLENIDEICEHYGNDSLEISILFSILYLAMIAEENKENTRLGKRIKRLAIHQALIEEMEPYVAANFSRGMGWRDISECCRQRGF